MRRQALDQPADRLFDPVDLATHHVRPDAVGHSIAAAGHAADAGVSLQTVSRVINNEPNVRAEMKKRVQDSIDKLGYVPSIAAQRMSGSRSYLILAINDRARTIADWQARLGTDWVDQMLLGGMLASGERGYRMLVELVDTHNDHVERELSAAIAALQPDGVILTPPHSDNPLITGPLAKRNISTGIAGYILFGLATSSVLRRAYSSPCIPPRLSSACSTLPIPCPL